MSDRRSPSKPRRVIGALVLGGILLWIAFGVGRAWIETRGVVYYIGGTARTALVRFTNAQGQREQHEVQVPWTSPSLRVAAGTRVSIDALPADNGTVNCRVNYDTNLVAQQPESDVGVLCSGFAGRSP